MMATIAKEGSNRHNVKTANKSQKHPKQHNDNEIDHKNRQIPQKIEDQKKEQLYDKVFRKLHGTLVDELDTARVIDELFTVGVMDYNDEEEITSKTTHRRKNTELMKFISRRGFAAKHHFLSALQKTSEHLYELVEAKIKEFEDITLDENENNEIAMPVFLGAKCEVDVKTEKSKNLEMIRNTVQEFLLNEKFQTDEMIEMFNKKLQITGATLDSITEGCVCLHLKFTNIHGLTKFYLSYLEGSFQKIVNEFLLTKDEKKMLGDATLKFSVNVDNSEYMNAVREILQGKSSVSLQSTVARNVTTQTEDPYMAHQACVAARCLVEPLSIPDTPDSQHSDELLPQTPKELKQRIRKQKSHQKKQGSSSLDDVTSTPKTDPSQESAYGSMEYDD